MWKVRRRRDGEEVLYSPHLLFISLLILDFLQKESVTQLGRCHVHTVYIQYLIWSISTFSLMNWFNNKPKMPNAKFKRICSEDAPVSVAMLISGHVSIFKLAPTLMWRKSSKSISCKIWAEVLFRNSFRWHFLSSDGRRYSSPAQIAIFWLSWRESCVPLAYKLLSNALSVERHSIVDSLLYNSSFNQSYILVVLCHMSCLMSHLI